MEDVDTFDFARYAKDYLQAKNCLSPRQAQILVLDHRIGPEMDEHIMDIMDDQSAIAALKSRNYNSAHLRGLNEFLDSIAGEYETREPFILDFLREIGHPIATGADENKRQSGCLLMFALLLIPLGTLALLFIL